MKISVIAGGRFHAFHLAHQLIKHNSLSKFYTFSYTNNDEIYVAKKYVNHIRIIQFIDLLYTKAYLSQIISAPAYNYYKDTLFDYQVSKIINPHEADIFIFWSNYGLRSIKKIKQQNPNAIIIVESGSCHIQKQYNILDQEFKKLGIHKPCVNKKTINKMCKEYQIANYITVPSSHVLQSFIEHKIPPKKMIKIPYGCNVSFFMQNMKHNQSSPFQVLFVGLAGIRKGIHYLIDAWKQLKIPFNQIHLTIVGNVQKELHQILKKKEIPPNITFYGSTTRENLRSLYQKAHIFILPSLEEGLAMVTAEAMASGLPVICSTRTGADELITNEKEGFLIEPADINSLTEKIRWCYNHQKEIRKMGLVGQKKIQQFSWDTYGTKIYKTYQTILNNNEKNTTRSKMQSG